MEHSLARWNFLKIAEFNQVCKNSELCKFAEFLLERKLKRNSIIAELKIFAEFECWNLLKNQNAEFFEIYF